MTGAVHENVKKLALMESNSMPCGALGFPTTFLPSQASELILRVSIAVGKLVPILFLLIAKN